MPWLARARKIESGFLDAAKTGNLLKVKKYISNRVDVEVRSKTSQTGWNGLHYASANGHLNIVQYLMESCHADKERRDFNGCTPLCIACRHGNLNIVHYLIGSCKVDIEAKDYFFECTALQIACRHGHVKIVQYLIQQGDVNMEAKDNEGWTALHHACEKGQLDIVRYLVESCRFNPHAKNKNGLTAYDLAEKNHKTVVMQYLKDTAQYLKDTAHLHTMSKEEPLVRTAGTLEPKRAQVGTVSNVVPDIAQDIILDQVRRSYHSLCSRILCTTFANLIVLYHNSSTSIILTTRPRPNRMIHQRVFIPSVKNCCSQ
jgi:Ankyrin repeats (3 copies)